MRTEVNKGHHKTGHEGPQGKQTYSSTLSLITIIIIIIIETAILGTSHIIWKVLQCEA
jgi:hypothetical protein